LRNTFGISIYTILVGIPAPVILAIMFNELRFRRFKTVAQTLSYAPNFLSVVVVVGIVFFFFSPSRGVINALRERFGSEAANFISDPRFFWHLYVWSGIWQTVGWSSIIYVASMSGIPEEQYEAAYMDGASKLQRIRYITLPGILPTIVIISILSFGRVLEVGFEKVYLLQTPLNLEASEVIRTYVYKSGIQGAQFSFAAAVDLFNNAVNFVILVVVNQVARTVGETSLW
jgi:putative aldouronate transport system permease protein